MMKHLLLATGLLLSPLGSMDASADDFRLSVQRKKAGPPERSGKATYESVYYEVSVENRAMRGDAQELQARYVIFVERQRIGEKIGTEKTERVTGEAKMAAMKPMAKEKFATEAIRLRDRKMAFCYYEGGERIRATDSIKGIWIKLYSGNEVVAEYTHPPAIKSRTTWG